MGNGREGLRRAAVATTLATCVGIAAHATSTSGAELSVIEVPAAVFEPAVRHPVAPIGSGTWDFTHVVFADMARPVVVSCVLGERVHVAGGGFEQQWELTVDVQYSFVEDWAEPTSEMHWLAQLDHSKNPRVEIDDLSPNGSAGMSGPLSSRTVVLFSTEAEELTGTVGFSFVSDWVTDKWGGSNIFWHIGKYAFEDGPCPFTR